MIVDKFRQLNFIGDIWEPHYNGYVQNHADKSMVEVYIASWRIDQSKLDIKLRFSKVNPTSSFAGDWYITKKQAKSFKRRFDNNGQECIVIPWLAFEPLEITERSMHLI